MHTKQELISLISKSHLDEDTIKELETIITIDRKKINILSEYLEKLGFSKYLKIARDLCEIDENSIYFCIPILNLENIKDLKQFNLYDHCVSLGLKIKKEAFIYLLNLKPESNKIIGKGESLIKILTKGTSTIKGDIKLPSSKIVEIKFNKSRIRGMFGYPGDASQVSEKLDTLFSQECYNIGGQEWYEDSLSFFEDSSNNGHWNFVSSKREKTYLLEDMIEYFGISPEKAIDMFVDSFKEYFIKASKIELQELKNSLLQEFDKFNKKKIFKIEGESYSTFIFKMCAFALKYYQKVEQFDDLLFIKEDFNCMLIKKDFIKNENLKTIAKFIRNNMKIGTPDLSDKAGPQGSAFSLYI